MDSLRITKHPILEIKKDRTPISFTFNDKTYSALEGDTIASALLSIGLRLLRYHDESGTPRGIYCNIGHCFECRVTVNSIEVTRACLTPVLDGMRIESRKPFPLPFKEESSI
jgi:sarcosine oxidase, subunit alpha